MNKTEELLQLSGCWEGRGEPAEATTLTTEVVLPAIHSLWMTTWVGVAQGPTVRGADEALGTQFTRTPAADPMKQNH